MDMLLDAKALGLGNKQVADIIGISPDKVSKVRAGKRRLSAVEAARFRQFFARRAAMNAAGRGEMAIVDADDLTKGLTIPVLDSNGWTLPRYDLAAFRGRDSSGRIEFPPVLEMVPVRRADLARLHATRSELWLVEMPTGVLPSVASPGELVICEDRGIAFRDRRIVILSIGDDPTIVRRVVRAADGTVQLVADDPAVPAIHAGRLAEGFNRFGDVLGAIRVTSVD